MKSSLLNMVLVLFGITAVAAFLVGLVNNVTKETIAQTEQRNKDLAKLEVLPEFEGDAEFEDKCCEIGDFKVNVTTVKAGDAVVGYAVEAPSITRGGYADRITLMVGFVEKDGATLINGIKVLKQSETPGLGANMTKEGNSLERSAVGKEPKSLKFAVSKEGGSFDALTGSTISSRAYANAVETAYAGYLWAKGELPSADVAKSGATKQEDTTSGATKCEDGKRGATKCNNEESEAQKGEVKNE
ncbi:MAG: RnfABCDGE type electron transport complex subunit G [Alistipes sp.]|nr:RnfABCDGE type electron transport complex subunit G [Alistipes sp.]